MKGLLLFLILLLTVGISVDAATRTANGVASPYREFALHKRTSLGETNLNWKFLPGDYDGDGIIDMYCIKQQGVDKTEVHILNGADNYSSFLAHIATKLHKTFASSFDFTLGDYDNDGELDLWAITKHGSSDTTEIHILNGAHDFQTFLLQRATALGPTMGPNFEYHVADWENDGKLDLICIDKSGTSVSILNGIANFQSLTLSNHSTALGPTSGNQNWSFAVGDYNRDGRLDIYAIKGQGVADTEVHILNGASQFDSFLRHARTWLGTNAGWPINSNWRFGVADYDNDGSLDILGINTRAAGRTEFHFLRETTRNFYWSDEAIWTGRSLPSSQDLVVIPAGRTIILDQAATMTGLEIEGSLLVQDTAGLTLTSDWILVNDGLFQVGTESKPFRNNFAITLTGADANTPLVSNHNLSGENAFLIVQGNSGQLHLHGASRGKRSWTQLGQTLTSTGNTILVEEPVNWSVGDMIVIASTDYDMNQAEEFIIRSISSDRRTLTLDKNAAHMHYGELQTYSNGRTTWELDERAEVGLLSRNIIVQGGSNSAVTKYGGHVIVKNGGFAQVEGCEFKQMGQKSIVGKYPFHWHMLGATSNQYFKDSSVHHTFNRAVTVHGTRNVLVEGVVFYDHIGHGMFLEDGSEYENSIIRNLGLVTRQMSESEATIPTDHTHPSTYWITHPDNTVRYNVAAGSDHAGFWYALPKTPTGDSASQKQIKPISTPLREFRNNVGHSNEFSNLAFDGSPNPTTQVLDTGRYQPRNADGSLFVPTIADFTSYKCRDRAIWMRAGTFAFDDIKSANNGKGTFFAYSQTISNSLIVGVSANIGTSTGPSVMRGHGIYDGPCGIENSHFAGFSGPHQAIQTTGAAQKSTVHWARGISFDDDMPVANRIDFSPATFRGYMWSSGLIDEDGSLTEIAGAVLMPHIRPDNRFPLHVYDDKFNVAETATLRSEWGAWVNSGAHFGLFRMNPSWPTGSAEEVQVTRCGGRYGCQTVTDIGTYKTYYQNPVIVNQDYTYHVHFSKIPKNFGLQLQFVNNGDSVIVKAANVPASTRVQQATQVSSYNQLAAAAATSYWLNKGQLWVKMVGTGNTNDPTAYHRQPFGIKYSATANVGITISEGSDPHRYNVLSDYNSGVDSRGRLASARGAGFRGINTGWGNTINWWDITSGADGRDGFVDYTFTPSSAQNWRFFQALRVSTRLAGEGKAPGKDYQYQVYLHDSQDGYQNLGLCSTGVCTLDLTGVSGIKLDSINYVQIRVHISFFADLNQAGAFQRVHLFSMTLV